LLRFAGGAEIAAAERFLGAFLHLDGVSEQAARALIFLRVAAIALRVGTAGLAAAGAAFGLLSLPLTLSGLLTGALSGLVALPALTLLLTLTGLLALAGLLTLPRLSLALLLSGLLTLTLLAGLTLTGLLLALSLLALLLRLAAA
jgi:hypothetical protein